MPVVAGPLQLSVIYPGPTDVVQAGDSSFMLGSTGNGSASLTINGAPVRVAPNGAWLAWLRFPPDSAARFELVARTPSDSASMVYEVHRAPRFVPPDTGLWIDTLALTPRGSVWLPADEYLPLRVHATPGAVVRLVLGDGTIVPLHAAPGAGEIPAAVRAFDRDTANLRATRDSSRYLGAIRGRRVGPDPGPIVPDGSMATLAAGVPAAPVPGAATLECDSLVVDGHRVKRLPAGAAAGRRIACQVPALPPPEAALPVLEVIRGADTARAVWPLRIALLDTVPSAVELDDDTAGTGATDSLTVGRALPAATYNWFFPTGTRSLVSGRLGEELRLQLSGESRAWVSAADAVPLAPGVALPLATIGSVTLTPMDDRASLRIPVTARVPFQVTETDHAVRIRFYHARGDVNWIRYGAADSLVKEIRWAQPAGDEVELTVETRPALWGYRTRWEQNDLILDVRRPPQIDPDHPLRGRLIVVDPGHPPIGATGPTGLRERDANLAVGLELRRLLTEAGAHVVMTRTTDVPVDLYPRTHLADSVGAEILLSIHNNALPDGVNPFINNGTSAFYNHIQSLPLARALQAALVRRLGLRDLGVGRGDLALVRPTWMPAVLTEGLYMIVPEQEAALRSPEGQHLYAQGLFDGLRQFLQSRAGEP